jgi:16S rRNA A1518/A1519 N6-dimethyltransferase RsmA/KsgA/DIM1 with predicted DNA glycosylase/AP lyase activity
MLSTKTREYYGTAKMSTRKEFGQYMTPDDIIDSALTNININQFNKILEPSCGTGQFIDKILKQNINANITGFEIDKDIYKF